jgi:abortive infection bacteriophage resistance protein
MQYSNESINAINKKDYAKNINLLRPLCSHAHLYQSEIKVGLPFGKKQVENRSPDTKQID